MRDERISKEAEGRAGQEEETVGIQVQRLRACAGKSISPGACSAGQVRRGTGRNRNGSWESNQIFWEPERRSSGVGVLFHNIKEPWVIFEQVHKLDQNWALLEHLGGTVG